MGHKNGAICFHNEKIQLSNCEGLHSSAKNTNHCLIGGKCGPCPIQTKFPPPPPPPPLFLFPTNACALAAEAKSSTLSPSAGLVSVLTRSTASSNTARCATNPRLTRVTAQSAS